MPTRRIATAPPSTKRRVMLTLPPDLYDRLRAAAFLRHTSLNAYVAAALATALDAEGKALDSVLAGLRRAEKE